MLTVKKKFHEKWVNPIPPVARRSSLKCSSKQPMGTVVLKISPQTKTWRFLCSENFFSLKLFSQLNLFKDSQSRSLQTTGNLWDCYIYSSPAWIRKILTCNDISISISSFLIPIQTDFPLTFCAMVLRSLSLKLPRSWKRKKEIRRAPAGTMLLSTGQSEWEVRMHFLA